MRPRYVVAGMDYPNQCWVFVGKKGRTFVLAQATVFRRFKRAERLARKYSLPKRDMREALVLDLFVRM